MARDGPMAINKMTYDRDRGLKMLANLHNDKVVVDVVIPPSHLFRISKNQAEPAGMKNFQNSRHIWEGITNPVTLEAEWAGMTAEWKLFMYS